MERIVMASGNEGKIKEAGEILKEYNIISMKELGVNIDVEEDKDTFLENAIKKSKEITQNLKGEIVIADDSGIEVEFLDGFPGVYTKRWHAGSDKERNLAILEKMKGVPKENRKVKFTTAIAASKEEKTISVSASIEGYVSENCRGENGFGFDEIFELENGKTLAELSDEEKNEISARRKAFELLKNELEKLKVQ